MHIIVATNNPNKILAVRELLDHYPFFNPYTLSNNAVPSGVSEQPLSLEETVQGASNRARTAFNNCQYSFGIESGITLIMYNRGTKYLNLTACIIFDGQQEYLGTSAGFEMPEAITNLIMQHNLDVDTASLQAGYTDNTRIGYAEGIISILSKGEINRKDYTKPAVQMAMFRLFSEKKK